MIVEESFEEKILVISRINVTRNIIRFHAGNVDFVFGNLRNQTNISKYRAMILSKYIDHK